MESQEIKWQMAEITYDKTKPPLIREITKLLWTPNQLENPVTQKKYIDKK